VGQPVIQWQILAKKPDAVAAFFSNLFGWTVNADNPLGYRAIDTGSKTGINGGIWPAPPEAPDFVQLFIEVDDMPGYVRKAQAAGAVVIIPPQKLPQGEEMAVLHAPGSVPFAMFKPAPETS
jgi:uncharacterized protein